MKPPEGPPEKSSFKKTPCVEKKMVKYFQDILIDTWGICMEVDSENI